MAAGFGVFVQYIMRHNGEEHKIAQIIVDME